MANKKRLIDANALIKDIDNYYNNSPFPHPGTTWLRGLELAVGLMLKAPTVDAYTEEQVASIIQQADKLEARNDELEKEIAWLKSCLNCKIRKECPRHCGKVVHDCDHWEYGDSTVDAVPLSEIYRVIAGHSNYHGDNILSALTCIAEGKEVKPVRPLATVDAVPVVRCKDCKWFNKTNRSIDMGYGGFNNLRNKVADLVGDPWASHYHKLDYAPIIGEARKKFYEEFDAETKRLLDDKKVSIKIVDFCLQPDCEGSIRYGACKQILAAIGDYDDNILYGYCGRPDCARFRDFKAILKDCVENKCDMVWR